MKIEFDDEQLPPLKAGDYVHYIPDAGDKENGRIKSIGSDGRASVVYKCAGEWEKYQEYTGAVTELNRLSRGWIDGDEPKENNTKQCDHHYIPTNAKWQSATQRQCCHCGDIID